MMALVTGRLAPWLAVTAAALAMTGTAWWLGGRDARRDTDALRGQIEAQRRMDDAGEIMRGRDDGGILDWLQRRGQ